MASRFAYVLTALGELDATSLGKIYDEFRVLEGDKPIPKRLGISQFQRALFVRFVVRSL